MLHLNHSCAFFHKLILIDIALLLFDINKNHNRNANNETRTNFHVELFLNDVSGHYSENFIMFHYHKCMITIAYSGKRVVQMLST